MSYRKYDYKSTYWSRPYNEEEFAPILEWIKGKIAVSNYFNFKLIAKERLEENGITYEQYQRIIALYERRE